MQFNKKDVKKQIKSLSDCTINFIKKYALGDLSISKPIDENMLVDILWYCADCYDEFADKECNPDFVIKDKQKCLLARDAETDIYNTMEYSIVDYEDLNKKLGL